MKQLAVVGICDDDGKALILLRLLDAVHDLEWGNERREFKFDGGLLILFPPVNQERMFVIHADETAANRVLKQLTKASERQNFRWRCTASY